MNADRLRDTQSFDRIGAATTRFGKAGKLLAEIGLDVEWEFIQSRILADVLR